jgi:hypothetical protein
VEELAVFSFDSVRSWLKDKFATSRIAARTGFRPRFEALESRDTPAGSMDVLVWGASWQSYYVGDDNDFHIQYSSNGGPVQNLNLSTALGSTTELFDQYAVNATTFGGRPYVFVATVANTVHAFYWTGASWAEASLSAAAGYNEPAVGYTLAAHIWNNLPHVFYIGTDQHVHELYWSAATGWQGVDVSAASGTSAFAGPNEVLTALVDNNNVERVYYQQATNLHIRELKWTAGVGWQDSDVSGAGQASFSGAWELSAMAVGSTVYLYYQGSNNHVYQLSNAGDGWVSTDLNAVVAGSFNANSSGSTLQAYVHDGAYFVTYKGTDSHLRQFVYTAAAGWQQHDLTAASSAASNVAAIHGGKIAALQYGDTQALFFLGANARINRMFNWNPLFGWQYVSGEYLY